MKEINKKHLNTSYIILRIYFSCHKKINRRRNLKWSNWSNLQMKTSWSRSKRMIWKWSRDFLKLSLTSITGTIFHNYIYRALFGLLILFCFNLYPVYWYFLYVRYKKLSHLHKEGKLVFRSSLTTFIFLDFYFCICVNIVSLLCIIGFFSNFFFILLIATIHDKIQKTFYDWAMNGFFLSLLYNGMRSFEQVYLSNDEDF